MMIDDTIISLAIRLFAGLVMASLTAYLIYKIAQVNAKSVVVRATILLLWSIALHGLAPVGVYIYMRLQRWGYSMDWLYPYDLYGATDLILLAALGLYAAAMISPYRRGLRLIFGIDSVVDVWRRARLTETLRREDSRGGDRG